MRRPIAGCSPTLHGERLRVDVVRDDVVRVKISRGGVFDEEPTFAVCVDPLAEPVGVRVSSAATTWSGCATAALVVSLWLDPFRLDVHRADGSAVVETAQDADGRWAYATLNDAFAIRRRRRPEDAIYGLGEKTGQPQPQRPRLHALEHRRPGPGRHRRVHRRARAATTRARTRASVEFDPYYVSIPFFYHQAQPAGTMVGLVHRQRLPGDVRLLARPRSTRSASRAASTPSTSSPGPDMPDILAAYTWLTGRAGAAAAVGARLPPVPLVPTTRRTRSRSSPRATASSTSPATRCGSTSSTWTATASSPGTPRQFPDVARHARPARRAGLPGDHDRRPGREARAGLPRSSTRRSSATSSAGPRAATSTSARSGPATPRSPTS